MKTAEIIRKYHGNMRDEVFLVEDEQDLANYAKFIQNVSVRTVVDVIKDSQPISKFDHMWFGKPPVQKGLMVGAYWRARLNAERESSGRMSILSNPLWQTGMTADLKIETIANLLDDGYPVAINKAGGFMLCRAKDIEIVRVFDSDAWLSMQKKPVAPLSPLVENPKLKGVLNGWLLPDGELHACEPYRHNHLTEQISGKKWNKSTEAGWIRLSYGDWNYDGEPTQKQTDTIFDWAVANGRT